jgi:ElaB/YqjD/DUF883 family membrane-anchored ribosome-binding protein
MDSTNQGIFRMFSRNHHENHHIGADEGKESNKDAGKGQPKNKDWCIMMTGDTVDRMVNKGVSGADHMKLQTAEVLEEAARKLRSVNMSTHGEDVKHILHDVESRMNQFKAEAGVKYHEWEADYHEKMEPVETMISDHPIPAVLIAISVGFLVGMLIGKSHD